MPDVAKKVINRLRNVHVEIKIPDPVDVRLAEAAGEIRQWELHQAGVELVRDRNFEKAKAARARNIELRRIEKERQEQIAEDRLKNLKKARKALARKRENNDA